VKKRNIESSLISLNVQFVCCGCMSNNQETKYLMLS
jgi:hypothetical protein